MVGDVEVEDLSSGAVTAPRAPRKRVKTARGSQTYDRLLHWAQQVFAEQGYLGTRISDIVLRANTSQGNFYRHFQNKDEILQRVLDPVLQELYADSNRRVGARANELEAIVEGTRGFLLAYTRHRRLVRVLREAAAVNPTFVQLWLQLREKFVARTERWLCRLQVERNVFIPDAHNLADALGCMVEQMAYVRLGLPPFPPVDRADIDLMAETLGWIWYRTISDAISNGADRQPPEDRPAIPERIARSGAGSLAGATRA